MSHQQVMSYLIGGGDHYKSHTFAFLNWDRLSAIRMERIVNETNKKEEQRMPVEDTKRESVATSTKNILSTTPIP
ncbi:hypothetical protein PAXINDRAFT_20963 [Paxillus involutus ATCC 200175]|uniref:Uncharacterized protein n=1 Tax=Paxillus involutus ATCC 200175 TaxID=664439 RepID=A0A0C9T2S0_PAXIN|nr:hypothetical protein PAXINDRAFT_20963 [Paxillus involutus ATCC 200175]